MDDGYFSADCRFTAPQDEEDFKIYLARGQDRAGNTYAQSHQVHEAWRERLLAE